MSELAERIDARLRATGKTARGASLEAGLGVDAIRSILKGRSASPRYSTVSALAGVLDCDVGYLMDGTSVRSSQEDVLQPARRPGGADGTGRHITAANGRVTLNINATVSMGTAAKILALIEEDRE